MEKNNNDTIKCPKCGESINPFAVSCPHCKEKLVINTKYEGYQADDPYALREYSIDEQNSLDALGLSVISIITLITIVLIPISLTAAIYTLFKAPTTNEKAFKIGLTVLIIDITIIIIFIIIYIFATYVF